MRTKFSTKQLARYKKAGYRIVGKHLHTGIEICRWAKSVLRGGRNCYKSAYGIKSHQCVQMTPTLDFCNLRCQWCWRTFGADRAKAARKWDGPKEIVAAAIESQKKLLSGFGGNPKTPKKTLAEAMAPKHFAISLDGEPTLYPKIAELIKDIKARGMTAFLVTNGTTPHKLMELLRKKAAPTNLYISVYGPDEKSFYDGTKTNLPKLWGKVLESLKLFQKFEKQGCRTVFRITCTKGLTMLLPIMYSKLIKMSKPMFVELKGYAWLGESRKRLPQHAVPFMRELEAFRKKIAKGTNYKQIAKDSTSRVLILVRDKTAWKQSLEKMREDGGYCISK